ncbi:AzlC family ABC transporter permease [Paenarthrobacter sp. NPDC057355]|uniref:AzlC family ABC transporter permease n=1 Tax=Paenarthrobacter sp. NPDC057355 TaxID=3346105 RepID=UPI00363E6A87
MNHTATLTAPPGHPIKAGLKDSFAAGLGMFPLGIAFGLLVIQSGLPWWVAPALSIAGFAGSLELLLIGMMTAMTPLGTIALTTLLVNFRHVFYSFTFPLHVVKHPLAKTLGEPPYLQHSQRRCSSLQYVFFKMYFESPGECPDRDRRHWACIRV